jgi:carbon starvation protein
MTTLLVAIGSFVGFLVAYHTYGRWLARRIFGLDPAALVPSRQLRDDVDFVPTRKAIVFGHHFTSIAGTGPIVGPAIAVFWGWLPALLWVIFGSIFIGAVHDFGSLVVSLRNRGQTVGQVAGRIIAPRTRVLFLLILFFALTVVLAIFGLVVASIFDMYPESVLSVWLSMPLAVMIGFWVCRRQGGILVPSLISLALLYAAVYVGAYYFPVRLDALLPANEWTNPKIAWTVILFIYCFCASVLPVWMLLQPRDYINSQQLLVALVLLVAGILVAGTTNRIDIFASAPPVASAAERPADAPPIWPFLFITIACGAVSGFHCVVSSGTSSKQVANEMDAQYIGYGAMLLEGALAVIVILACCAGIGMGEFERTDNGPTVAAGLIQPYEYQEKITADGSHLTGRAAWEARYNPDKSWRSYNLGPLVGAFVDGGANFLAALGLPIKLGVATIAVLVACFAATTLDSATRLQRYVVQELAESFHIRPLQNKYLATGFAVALALALAIMRGPGGVPGTGGLFLWPLFGATNQLLAGLAFMVVVFYLWRRDKPIWFAVPPMLLMIVMPAWALVWQMFNAETGWYHHNLLLFSIGAVVMVLQVWMLVEGLLVWRKARGALEEQLPPLPGEPRAESREARAGGVGA